MFREFHEEREEEFTRVIEKLKKENEKLEKENNDLRFEIWLLKDRVFHHEMGPYWDDV